MKNRRIIAGTVLAATVLCWALWGDTAKVDTVPAATTERAVSAPCAPQVEPTAPSNNIDISGPVTESETIPVAGSSASPTQECPQETPMLVPTSTPAEEAIAKSPATIPEPAPQKKQQCKRRQRHHRQHRTAWSMSPASAGFKAKAPANGQSAETCMKTATRSAAWDKRA